MRKFVLTVVTALAVCSAVAQQNPEIKDSLRLQENDKNMPAKVLHAEPLYVDLIRDLGARKGEKEWNVGLGITDNLPYDSYLALVEYEWAPADRLGLEIELPFTLYTKDQGRSGLPGNKLNSVKLAGQYTFLVSTQHNTSMAIGYIHEFEMNEFKAYKTDRMFAGNLYNPFLVAAKRWGQNYHTLLYTGPAILKHFNEKAITNWQINSNFHYMINGTRNFVGVEFNKELHKKDFDMTIRPQMRLAIKDNLMVGIVAGIPVKRENERFSSFLRLIYEPGH